MISPIRRERGLLKEYLSVKINVNVYKLLEQSIVNAFIVNVML